MMKMQRIMQISTLVLGVISFLCLIVYFMALTDIWHENGSPNFWQGEGVAALEWQVLGYSYWLIFLFHVLFLSQGFWKLYQEGKSSV